MITQITEIVHTGKKTKKKKKQTKTKTKKRIKILHKLKRYSNSLGAGWSKDQILVGV